MTVVEETPALKPPDEDGAPPAGSEGGRPGCLLVVLHTPSGENVGAKVEIDSAAFEIGASGDDLVVEGALESGTRAQILWSAAEDSASRSEWHLKGSGLLALNGRPTIEGALKTGDELRVVDSFFRFLSGSNVEEKYYETIYQLTIVDIPSGAHNRRYLREVLVREEERATRRGKTFSVAVVSVRPEPGNQKGAHDLLRFVVKGLSERLASDCVIARTDEHEFAVVGPEAAAEFEEYLRPKLLRCLPERVQAHLGVIQYEIDLDPEQLVRKARDNAVPLAG